jgi:hypothetical protein
LEGGFFTGDPAGYVEDGSGDGHLLRSPNGESGRELIYQGLLRLGEGALEVERLFLRGLCEWNLLGRGCFFTVDPEGYVKEGSGDGHIFPQGPLFWGTWRDAPFLGPLREGKKISLCRGIL